MIKVDKENFIKICEESRSMLNAAKNLGIHFNTFKRYAVKFGCYNKNQAGRGISRLRKINIYDYLNNTFAIQSFKLKNYLIKAKLKINKCEICNIENWLNKNINCELHHIDGNKYNNNLSNLRILCPNCHSQTDTFRSKNKKKI